MKEALLRIARQLYSTGETSFIQYIILLRAWSGSGVLPWWRQKRLFSKHFSIHHTTDRRGQLPCFIFLLLCECYYCCWQVKFLFLGKSTTTQPELLSCIKWWTPHRLISSQHLWRWVPCRPACHHRIKRRCLMDLRELRQVLPAGWAWLTTASLSTLTASRREVQLAKIWTLPGWSAPWTPSWCGRVDNAERWHRRIQKCITLRSVRG